MPEYNIVVYVLSSVLRTFYRCDFLRDLLSQSLRDRDEVPARCEFLTGDVRVRPYHLKKYEEWKCSTVKAAHPEKCQLQV
jgi:hypothetical protein